MDNGLYRMQWGSAIVMVGVAGSLSWSQNPLGSDTIEPDLSSTSMTLGVTIGMLTTASPQSSGSKVVLSPAVGSLAVPVAVPSADVGVVALASDDDSAPLSDAVMVIEAAVSVAIVFEFEFEFESSEFDLLSPHAPVRSDKEVRRHALRFISW